MNEPAVRVLLTDDVLTDAELEVRELKRAGLRVTQCITDSEESFERALREFKPDVILSDFSMPQFDGMAALRLARELAPEVPFIFVSGTIGEEYAVRALKNGATDYVLKGNLVRLPAAVERALAEARERLAKRRTEEELHRFKLAMDNSADVIVIIDRAAMRIVDVNQTACTLLGYTREELLGMGPADILPATREELEKAYDALIADPSRPGGMSSYYRCKDGSRLPFESTRRAMRSGERWLIVAVSRDIRERIAAEQALRESEAGLRRAQVMAKLAHIITGPAGSFESWSDTLPELIGVRPHQVPSTTRDWLRLLHPEDAPSFQARAIEAARTRTRTKVKYRLRHAGGEWIHIRQTMDPLDAKDDGVDGLRWFNTIQDVSEQREAETKIERLGRVYAVLSGINAAIVRIKDRQQLFDEACRVASQAGLFPVVWLGTVDPAGKRITPVAWSERGGEWLKSANHRLSIEKGAVNPRAQAVQEKKAFVANDVETDPRIKLKELHRSFGVRSMAVLPLVVSGEVVGVLCLHAAAAGFFDEEEMKLLLELAGDIGFALEHIEKSEQLNYLAYYDALTGLANAALLRERLAQYVGSAGREQYRLALFIIDIERFKTINDAFGRQVGDALLKGVAERLVKLTGEPAHLGRVGADHFAVVIPHFRSEENLLRRLEDAKQLVDSTPYQVGDTELRISTRAGVAMYPDDATSADDLFRNAEAALKRSTSAEQYLFYKPQMTERIAEKITLENQLRQALERNEFVLHYQPKVNLADRAVVGLEALIRWQSPQGGLVPPMKFIPLLEETGLILDVGAWALKQAALDHRAWVAAGLKAPRVAVNVSPIQLRQRNFVSVVEKAIMEGAAPTGIDLEITESLIMQDIHANIEKLVLVRKLGLSVAIDDFGTGYSSLAYLARLPVETLKIDRSFVITMVEDPNTATLVQTIISLAHNLGLKVVAEGVESEEQAKVLHLLRCDQMQGYVFSKPLPRDEITAMLRKGV